MINICLIFSLLVLSQNVFAATLDLAEDSILRAINEVQNQLNPRRAAVEDLELNKYWVCKIYTNIERAKYFSDRSSVNLIASQSSSSSWIDLHFSNLQGFELSTRSVVTDVVEKEGVRRHRQKGRGYRNKRKHPIGKTLGNKDNLDLQMYVTTKSIDSEDKVGDLVIKILKSDRHIASFICPKELVKSNLAPVRPKNRKGHNRVR